MAQGALKGRVGWRDSSATENKKATFCRGRLLCSPETDLWIGKGI